MLKSKIIEASSVEYLQHQLDKFINDSTIDIKHICYSMADSDYSSVYSVLIIYQLVAGVNKPNKILG